MSPPNISATSHTPEPVPARTTTMCDRCRVEQTRIDKWLWAVRLYPTRNAASVGCSAGHVRVNGATAKPSTTVRIGDHVTAFAGGRDRILEVVKIIEKRVSATLAAECVLDNSPPPPPRDDLAAPFARARGTGRPTKRDRRQMDRFRGR
jgi:ribosomal 50S subunit-recycling heat shock protein